MEMKEKYLTIIKTEGGSKQLEISERIVQGEEWKNFKIRVQ
jgi:hypothetical protein